MRKILLPLICMGILATTGPAAAQSEPYVGNIMTVAFDFCPGGWAAMDGSLLSIAENEVLFSLIGTTYGSGENSFGLPRAPAEYLADGTLLRQCISLFGVIPDPQP